MTKKTIEIISRTGQELFSHVAYGNTVKTTLEKACAERVDLQYAAITNAQLEGINFRQAVLHGVNFTSSNLADAKLSFARMEFAEAVWANFPGATATGANFYKAAIRSSNFANATLRSINAVEANFTCCSFFGADLRSANLYGADLSGADLREASLTGANLQHADLFGVRLTDDIHTVTRHPLFQIGPIGTRDATLNCWVTNKGLILQTGCFFGTEAEFIERSDSTHRANPVQRKMYRAAIDLARIYAQDRTPKENYRRRLADTGTVDFYIVENGDKTPLVCREKDLESVQYKVERNKHFFGNGRGVTIRNRSGAPLVSYNDKGWGDWRVRDVQ